VLASDPNDRRGVWFPAHFSEHPKIDRLSDAAFRFWASGLAFCSTHLTDGHIPRVCLRRIAGGRVRKKLLAELLEVVQPYGSALWEPDPGGNGYWVHDYLEWNPSRAEMLAAQDAIRGELLWDEEGEPIGWARREPSR
jgi:hypothetical protein